MPSNSDRIVVLITTPKGEGKKIARALVESRLAACVNVVPGLTSLYWWQGEIQEDQEELLIVKTRADVLDRLVAEVKRIHPYSVPEVIALPILGGNPDYMRWVDEEVRPG